MIRNLKALGLALVAVFAMSAVAASAASAQQGVVTSDGTFKLVGEEVNEVAGENELAYPGLPGARCPGSTFHGGEIDETIEAGTHGFLHGGESAFTVSPTYANCKVGIFPATVTMNGCDFDFELGETESTDTYELTAELTCPEENEVHLEAFSDAGHTNMICTVTFGPQHPDSSGLHATDNNNGTVSVKGTVTGIHATKHSFGGCPPTEGTTTAATYKVNVLMTGENEEGEPTGVSLSH